jgi:hypothetical protein
LLRELFVVQVLPEKGKLIMYFKPALWNKSYSKDKYSLKVPDEHKPFMRYEGLPHDSVEVSRWGWWDDEIHACPVPNNLEWESSNVTSLRTLVEWAWSFMPYFHWSFPNRSNDLLVAVSPRSPRLPEGMLHEALAAVELNYGFRFGESTISLMSVCDWDIVYPECACGCGASMGENHCKPPRDETWESFMEDVRSYDQELDVWNIEHVAQEKDVLASLGKLSVHKKDKKRSNHPYQGGGRQGGSGAKPRNPFQ